MHYSDIHVLAIENRAEDILYIKTERPKDFTFEPGQAAELRIQKPGWEKIGRPFAITVAPTSKFLCFIIKAYPSQAGFITQIFRLKVGDTLSLSEPFGSIHYQETGVFIAGGIGIAPFLSIFRDLKQKNKLEGNKLIFANKRSTDIILEEELRELFGENMVIILSHEEEEMYDFGFVDKEYLQELGVPKNQFYYLCGPPPMMDALEKHLVEIGVNKEQIIL